jgi:hypothetical protein
MSRYSPLVGVALFASVAGLIAWRSAVHGRKLETARQEALKAFRSSCAKSTDPKFGFSGASATIVKIEEPANPHRESASWFTLTIFARNEFGEYFMFKSAKPTPFLKHMNHVVAKQVLRHEYTPPPEA